MNTQNQAQKGGEIGINGDFYKGGQFLPNFETTIKGAVKIKAGNKKPIEPFKWEKSPADNMLSIYDRVGWLVRDNRKECEFVKGVGFIGLKLQVRDMKYCSIAPHERPLTDQEREWAEKMVAKFNNGERWFPLADDPFHYLNKEK